MAEIVQQAIQFFQSAPMTIRIVSGLLIFLAVLFFFRFLLPALWMHMRFSSMIRQLQRIKRENGVDIAPIFARDKTLNHLWTEYEHTIHRQYNQVYSPADGGQSRPSPEPLRRSTVPAAAIFTTEAMVDSRLSTEFFKHLPGLFTGIGIIGTFSGLITGLQAFKVSENATVVRNSLEKLMQGVYEAFLVSAVAISAAMVATALERWLITGLYKKAEAITFEIDGMFESGVEEEYLERLVSAAEEGTGQSKLLKDALVTELGNILSKLTEHQIEAQRNATRDLGAQISEGIATGIAEPLSRIAITAGEATEGNTQAVTNLLTDVLASFSQRLEELFGGQIGGINQLQQQTIESLTKATTALETMAAKIETAGTSSSEAIAQQITEAMTSMEGHQRVMNDRMAEFIEQIRGSARDEQQETSRALQSMIADLGEAARLQIKALNDAGGLAANTSAEREGRLAAQADEAAGKLASLTEGVMAEIRLLTGEIRQTTSAMQTITSDAVARMNIGAEALAKAAGDFSQAGQGVTGVLQQAAGVSGSLKEAAGSLSSSSSVLKGVIDDHALARASLASMIEQLQVIVDSARREAAVTSDVITRIESSAEKLGGAQKQAEEYLAGVTEALASAHGEFSEGLSKVVTEANGDFHRSLSSATGLLRDAIEELAATVDVIPSARSAPQKERI